jgi:hypothetical protein
MVAAVRRPRQTKFRNSSMESRACFKTCARVDLLIGR